jgi:hypothetical protein
MGRARKSKDSSGGILPLRGDQWTLLDVRCDQLCPLYVDSGHPAVAPLYLEILATTIRAISGLSRQTPSVRITKSADSKTCDLTNHRAIDPWPLRLH